MKNILKLTTLFFLFAFSVKAYSQLDTLKYLKQFEIDKNRYIGKSFSDLLGNLKFKPTILNLKSTENCYYASYFGFTRKKNNIEMYIIWDECFISSPNFGIEMEKGVSFLPYTSCEEEVLKEKVIKDIKVYDISSPFLWQVGCKVRMQAIDLHQFLIDRYAEYVNITFEQFLCKIIMEAEIISFKNFSGEKGKINATSFKLRPYKGMMDQTEARSVYMEIFWSQPFSESLLKKVNEKLLLEDIRLMKNFRIYDIKVYRDKEN